MGRRFRPLDPTPRRCQYPPPPQVCVPSPEVLVGRRATLRPPLPATALLPYPDLVRSGSGCGGGVVMGEPGTVDSSAFTPLLSPHCPPPHGGPPPSNPSPPRNNPHPPRPHPPTHLRRTTPWAGCHVRLQVSTSPDVRTAKKVGAGLAGLPRCPRTRSHPPLHTPLPAGRRPMCRRPSAHRRTPFPPPIAGSLLRRGRTGGLPVSTLKGGSSSTHRGVRASLRDRKRNCDRSASYTWPACTAKNRSAALIGAGLDVPALFSSYLWGRTMRAPQAAGPSVPAACGSRPTFPSS